MAATPVIHEPRQLALISCEVMFREMATVVAQSPNVIDLKFLPKGLHDLGCKQMSSRIQTCIDAIDTSRYEAILLGYGLCNNGIAGLVARQIPLVVPRAHDCIALFMGSRHRYADYFTDNPGTYFRTTGWLERSGVEDELSQLTVQHQTGMDRTLEQFIDKYGEDNGRYLYDQLGEHRRNYSKLTFIEMGIEPDDSHENTARNEAKERDWKFEKVSGEMSLFRRLVDGDWDAADFLVVPSGHRIIATYDHERVVDIEPVE